VRRLQGYEIAIGALFATAFWVLIFVLTSDAASHYEICEITKEGAKECASHNVIGFAFRKIGAGLDVFSAAITAIATIFIAGFTWTLKRSTDKLWGITDRTLKSTERNLEAIERAYIFFGYSPLKFQHGQATFTLFAVNSGRMPGGIKKVSYKFLPRSALPTSREEIDWDWEVLPYDYIVRPGRKVDIRKFLSLGGNHIFVSRVDYQDLFTRKMHTSWMGMHIYATTEETARAGGDVWNDWN
jgi:hypothetical protein